MTLNQKLFALKRKVIIWTIIWLFSLIIATFGPNFIWKSNVTFTLIGIGANFLLGIIMIRHNVAFILGLDEMLRKIHLEAMSISLGVGTLVGFGYSLLSINDFLPEDMGFPIIVFVFSITYLASIFWSNRRLR